MCVCVCACVCHYRLSLVQDATDEQLTGPVKLVVDESLPKLLNGKSSLDEFNRDYLTRHKDSIVHLITGQDVLSNRIVKNHLVL